MKTIQNIFWLTLCSVLFLTCSKDGENGGIGPKGNQGEQGIAGTDGVGEQGIAGSDGQGEQEEQGETGTANVIYSDWITLDFGDTPINTTSISQNVDVPDLTQEIKDNGVVLVYSRNTINALDYEYYTLPYHRYNPDFQYYSHKFFSHVNRINISISTRKVLSFSQHFLLNSDMLSFLEGFQQVARTQSIIPK